MTVMTPSTRTSAGRCCTRRSRWNPRGGALSARQRPGAPIDRNAALPLGKGESGGRAGVACQKEVAILAFGPMLHPALKAAKSLDATVANMRFVKPLDEALVRELARRHDLLVTVEENVIAGGAGSAVLEALQRPRCRSRCCRLGLPDRFIDQGDPGCSLPRRARPRRHRRIHPAVALSRAGVD
jgi:1-deoxy-D-xylulose-5-phosphate synthase